MSDLNKDSIQALEKTMQFMENRIRDLNPTEKLDQGKKQLEDFIRIRENIWQLKQINPIFYNIRAKQNILDNENSLNLVEDINQVIQTHAKDIGINPIQFKTTRFNRDDRELDDTINVAFFMTSFCSKEKKLPKDGTEKSFLERSSNALAPYIQPSPNLKWKILGMMGLSTLWFINPIAGAGVTAGVGVYYRKEIYGALTGAQDASSGQQTRVTKSATPEEIRQRKEEELKRRLEVEKKSSLQIVKNNKVQDNSKNKDLNSTNNTGPSNNTGAYNNFK